MDIYNKRLLKILELFIDSKYILTSETIALSLGVTSRTIRKDIKELNELLKEYDSEIISEFGRGYFLQTKERQKLYQLIHKEKEEKTVSLQCNIIPTEPDDRVYYIFSKLLKNALNQKEVISLFDLEEELFISTSTLKKDLKIISNQIDKFDLKVSVTQKEGVHIVGNERNIRYCISEFMFHNTSLNTISESKFYTDIFSEEEIESIKEILLEVIIKNNIRLTDIAFKNMLVHILIMLKRFYHKNKFNCEILDIQFKQNTKEFHCAEQLIEKIECKMGIQLGDEVYYLAQQLISSSKFMIEDLNEDYKVKESVEFILKNINDELRVNFLEDTELITGLVMHLKVALMRLKFNMNIRNEFLEYMKSIYPFAFEIAVLTGKYIEEMFDIKTKENEIGFLAMHFGAALERKGLSEYNAERKNIIIVCAAGAATATLLKECIRKRFGNKLKIIKVCALYEITQKLIDEVDFVLTTVPIKKFSSDKIKKINVFLTNQDIISIHSLISGDKFNPSYYSAIFKEDLFFDGLNVKTKYDVLDILTNEMIEKGYITDDVKKSVYQREEIATTELGSLVAIPHALLNEMEEASVAVAILEKPIVWKKEKVQVVFLLSIPKNKYRLWESVFKNLYYYLIENVGVGKLIKGIGYKKFIKELELQYEEVHV